MQRLAILGASGHGKAVAEVAELCGWQEIHFYDDDWLSPKGAMPWPVLGDTNGLLENIANYDGIIVAIGNNVVRYGRSLFLSESGGRLVTLVHPRAIVSSYAQIAPGCVVMAGAIVNPFAKIGFATIINTAATIDHDCLLGQGIHVSPGANLAGGVTVGDLSWIGIGASVKQCVAIGRQVIVGAGAVVVSHIADGLTVVGVPAKAIDSRISIC